MISLSQRCGVRRRRREPTASCCCAQRGANVCRKSSTAQNKVSTFIVNLAWSFLGNFWKGYTILSQVSTLGVLSTVSRTQVNRQTQWWLVGSIGGGLVGFGLVSSFNQSSGYALVLIPAPVITIWLVQARVLRTHIRRANLWVAATVLGTIIFVCVAYRFLRTNIIFRCCLEGDIAAGRAENSILFHENLAPYLKPNFREKE